MSTSRSEISASSVSQSACRPSQKPGVVPKNAARRKAVSAVMARLPKQTARNTRLGDSDLLRQPILANLQRHKKLRAQHFPGVNVGQSFHVKSSRVVTDFDIVSMSVVPDEAHLPLVVDADAPLPFSTSLQNFQTIIGGNAQIINASRIINHPQLAPCHYLNLHRQFFRKLAQPHL